MAKKLYPSYGTAVNRKMQNALNFVTKKSGGELQDKDRILLDNLADLLNLYDLTRDHIAKNGISEIDRFGNLVKSPYIKQLMELNVQILKICNIYGLSLKDEQKLHDQDAQGDLLTNAINSLNDDYEDEQG